LADVCLYLGYILGVLQTVAVDPVASMSNEYAATFVVRMILGSNSL